MQEGKVDPTARDAGLEALIASAVRAPSSHNTQPWRFRPEDGGVSLHADRERRLAVNDPSDRELTISCGCALMNLRAAAAAAGQVYRLELFPEGQHSPCLARMTWAEGASEAAESVLASAIEDRRTCRRRFASSLVPQTSVEALQAAALHEGVRLQDVPPGEQRRAVARLVEEGDRVQWRDSHWRAELASWIRSAGRGEGLGVPAIVAPFARFAVKRFDMGKRVGAHDRQLTEGAPRLLALWTDGDRPSDWLRAGQALERALLTASGLGFQASHLNQPMQVATLRPRLCEALGEAGYPQILLRVGHAPGILPATARRSVVDVMGATTP